MSNSDIANIIYDSVIEGNFYDRQSIHGLLNGRKNISLGDVSKALAKLKREGIATYADMMWTFRKLRTTHTDSSAYVEPKVPGLDVMSVIMDGVNEFVEKRVGEKIDEIAFNSTSEFARRFEVAIEQQINEKLAQVISKNKEQAIIKATQDVVKEEFRMEVVPVLVTNIRNRVDQEISERLQKTDKFVRTLTARQIKYENLLTAIGELIEDNLTEGN